MNSLLTPTMFSLVLLLGAASVHAKPSPQPISQILDRASYVGGWPLALAASESSGCPGYAPVTVKDQYTALQCCPSGQTGFLDENTLSQYCCPDKNDCLDNVKLFPACANSTWIMYEYGQGADYFCCEPGQIATQGDGDGLCEPAGVAVPSDMIRPTVSQDTVAAAAATSSSAAVAATTTMTSAAAVTTTASSASSVVVVVSTDTKVSALTTTSTVGGSAGNYSSTVGGGNSTPAVPSRGANTTATTLTSVTVGNPVSASATVSATGAASGTASPSAKTGGSGSVRAASDVMGAVAVALCLGVGVEVLLG